LARKWSNNEFRRCSFFCFKIFRCWYSKCINVHDPRTGEILESHWMVS
jgi:hypothetical protein